jgi:hypothetical protein
MKNCYQTSGINMLQHGEMVHSEYQALIDSLENGELTELIPIYSLIKNKLIPIDQLKNPQIFHDCGKHICLIVDDSGKRHYPNHAAVSAQQYSLIFPNDQIGKQLIEMDMLFHTARGEDLVSLCKHPLAPTLYLTAWAEINANCSMFGGKESESYKIKKSRLLKAGKKLKEIWS